MYVHVETLESGDEETPWLLLPSRQLVRRRAVGYLTRHRVSVVLVCTAALLGGAVAAHAGTRPAAPEPLVRLTLSAAPAAGGAVGIHNISTLSSAAGTGLAAEYLATTTDLGDAVDVQGIVGPGLSTVSFSSAPVTAGRVATVTLAGMLDCDDDGWWTATDAQYRVRVVATDASRRSRSALAPLIGADATGWREAVQRGCLTATLARARWDHWVVSTDVRRHVVTLSVRVHNPGDRRLYLQVAFPGRPSAADAVVVGVAPHGTATLVTRWPSTLCRWVPAELLPTASSLSGTTVLMLRVGVAPFAPPGLIGEDPYRTAVTLPASAGGLSARVARACHLADYPHLGGTWGAGPGVSLVGTAMAGGR